MDPKENDSPPSPPEGDPLMKPDRELPAPHDMLLEDGQDAQIPPNATPEPSHAKKHVFPLWIFPVIAFLIVLFAGAWYFLGAQQSSSESVQPEVSIESSPSPTPDPTANWQTYNSGDLGFSIKIPHDWTIREPTVSDPTLYLRAPAIPDESDPHLFQYFVAVSEYKNSDLQSFEEVVTASLDKDLKDSFTYTEETLGEHTVYKTESLPSRSGSITAFITHDETSYISLGFTPYDRTDPFEEQQEYLSIFNQILSTFKFVNQASPSAHTSQSTVQQVCTMDAKVCPDGSSVGRTGPNCSFAACPGE